jgi:superfamily II DNA/RNA helicase
MQTTFKQEVGEILTFLPAAGQRQTLLFSATIPSTIPIVRPTASSLRSVSRPR